MATDTFIHSGLASNPANRSEGALPGPNDSPPNTGYFGQGTLVMAGQPPKLSLIDNGGPTLVMLGQQDANVAMVGGTTLKVVAAGDNTLRLGTGAPSSGPENVRFAGTLNLNGDVGSGAGLTVSGAGLLNANLSLYPSHISSPAAVEIDAQTSDTSIIQVVGSTLIFDQLRFLQPTEAITINDNTKPFSLPTLEIEHLPALTGITLNANDLTLYFQHGGEVSLPNVHVADPQDYLAAQTFSESIRKHS